MSGQVWTPAPKKGIIPLHPMTFGMLLGKPFAALRHNPKVLFGFAVVLQLVVVLTSAAVMIFVFVGAYTRLMTVPAGSEDFEAIVAGTVGLIVVAGIAVSFASIAFTSMMQGVVAAEIGYAAVGVKATLRMLWRKMAPALWRLICFGALSVLVVFGIVAIAAGILIAIASSGIRNTAELVGIVALIVVLMALASVPLLIWLSTKLLLVPSILVLERATLRVALVRSWRLTRGRFWVAFGVTFLISAIMGLAMQVVSIPTSLLSGMLGAVIAPTGNPEASAVVAYVVALLAPQILVLALQAITLVVQSSGAALIYIDCRMRYEGLDQALMVYLERRDLGWAEEHLGDPFTAYPQPFRQPHPAPAYPAPAYPAQAYPAQAYAAPPPPASAAPAAPTPPSDSPWAPDPGGWTAPGSDS